MRLKLFHKKHFTFYNSPTQEPPPLPSRAQLNLNRKSFTVQKAKGRIFFCVKLTVIPAYTRLVSTIKDSATANHNQRLASIRTVSPEKFPFHGSKLCLGLFFRKALFLAEKFCAISRGKLSDGFANICR